MPVSWSVEEVQMFLSLIAEERIQQELDGSLMGFFRRSLSSWPYTATTDSRGGATITTCIPPRGSLMHGLQGAEAQGPTLERGPTGCREIIFF